MDNRTCSIDGCGKPHQAKGWCGKHYQSWQKYGDPLATTRDQPANRRRFVTVGQRFGRWVVTGPEVQTEPTKGNPCGLRAAPVRCSCPRGTERVVTFSSLFAGTSRCCGCIGTENASQRLREANPAITHGLTRHPLFDTWKAVLRRCENPADKDWPRYGALGVSVHEAWHDPAAFTAWIDEHLGERPDGMSLDRVDGTGNYEPGNVRWASALQQRHNRRPARQCVCGTEYHTTAKTCRTCGATLRT